MFKIYNINDNKGSSVTESYIIHHTMNIRYDSISKALCTRTFRLRGEESFYLSMKLVIPAFLTFINPVKRPC